MKIAIAGGTGTIGRLVAAATTAAGHEPVVLARATGVNVLTGAGLTTALSGVDALIDASATSSTSTKKAVHFFGTATRNLLEAERNAGVGHHVAISIVGAAQVNANYYAGKAVQEEILLAQPAGWSMVRTTQVHEFAVQIAGHGKVGPVHVVPTMRSQPIAATEVAAELVRIAVGPPQGLLPDLAGPREERLADMVRRYLTATGRSRPTIEVPFPGPWGRSMRDGTLLPSAATRRGRQTFEEWLETQRP